MPFPKINCARIQLILGGLSLVLVLALIVLSLVNRNLQRSIQVQQIQINNGRVTKQVATNIIRDLAQISVRDQEIAALLKKYGFEVKVQNNPSSSTPTR